MQDVLSCVFREDSARSGIAEVLSPDIARSVSAADHGRLETGRDRPQSGIWPRGLAPETRARNATRSVRTRAGQPKLAKRVFSRNLGPDRAADAAAPPRLLRMGHCVARRTHRPIPLQSAKNVQLQDLYCSRKKQLSESSFVGRLDLAISVVQRCSRCFRVV